MDYYKKSFRERFWRHLISAPFIFGVFPAVLLLDLCVEIYHRICFPLYGLPIIRRSDFVVIDRHKLEYLNFKEKIGCVYCGYVNGVFHYVSAIAAATEQYFCGIRHQGHPSFREPAHHKKFLPYGDKKTFLAKIKKK